LPSKSVWKLRPPRQFAGKSSSLDNNAQFERLSKEHRFSNKFHGLDMKLTGVEPAKVIKGILA